MTDFSLRGARIQLGALLAALILAILIALGITAGAFVLSFAVQRDLARQAMIPDHLAWIFPSIVDSAILGSTIALVVLSKLKTGRTDKPFWIALACSVVTISILGNGYHAFHAAAEANAQMAGGENLGFTPLAPAVAALIAVIPPALVLAFTHGIGILIKAVGTAYAAYRAAVDDHPRSEILPQDATADVSAPPERNGGGQAPELFASLDSEPSAPPAEEEQELLGAASSPPLESSEDLYAQLEMFIDTVDLPQSVKDTARRKLADPSLTWEVIAQTSIPPVATSTAWRRYDRFDAEARAAGFSNPPLFDLRAADQASADQLVTAS